MISGLDRAQTVHLSANCTVTVPIDFRSPASLRSPRRLSSPELRTSLQFHLRILFEDLCVFLAKHLSPPLIGHASCAQPRGIGGAKIVDSSQVRISNRNPTASERGVFPPRGEVVLLFPL